MNKVLVLALFAVSVMAVVGCGERTTTATHDPNAPTTAATEQVDPTTGQPVVGASPVSPN
jgi:hypothetical protein